ncbi:MAG TPA: sugar ABC transporter permease [Bacilli bacterium]|nr:sugar ABC transporter permease [Bacilli bacterium]
MEQNEINRIPEVEPLTQGKWLLLSGKETLLKLLKFIVGIFVLFGRTFYNILRGIYKGIIKLGLLIRDFSVKTYKQFTRGGWRTKLSYFLMGSGHSFMARPIKTIIYLGIQIAFFVFMFIPGGGIYWVKQITTLGTVASIQVPGYCSHPFLKDPCPEEYLTYETKFMDDSMQIMLFSVAVIILIIVFLVIYFISVDGVYKAEQVYAPVKKDYKERKKVAVTEETTELSFVNKLKLRLSGWYKSNYKASEVSDTPEKPVFKNPLPTFVDELRRLLNDRFHFATLSIPTITITIFTVLPLVFMILLAFTNFDKAHGPPNTLFTWVGFDTFRKLFTTKGSASFGSAMWAILKWTFVWAFFATFSNYIGGLLLAMVINRRSIKLKKLWRTMFVISIAVPQFVTLLLMSQLLKDNGPLNMTLRQWGVIDESIRFLSRKTNARITVILVNLWIGVPYTMLVTSGILMNIPSDLYESARIDGAGPVTQFFKITLPYMLFVTGPYLITSFIGNINNFNVIFFLTGGGPTSGSFGVNYGHTDILITWLYNLTVGGAEQEYAVGSALGIFIFLISAFITLTLYSQTSAAQQEGDFA